MTALAQVALPAVSMESVTCHCHPLDASSSLEGACLLACCLPHWGRSRPQEEDSSLALSPLFPDLSSPVLLALNGQAGLGGRRVSVPMALQCDGMPWLILQVMEMINIRECIQVCLRSRDELSDLRA